MRDRITITLDKNVALRVRAIAESERRSFSNAVEVLLAEALERQSDSRWRAQAAAMIRGDTWRRRE